MMSNLLSMLYAVYYSDFVSSVIKFNTVYLITGTFYSVDDFVSFFCIPNHSV